MTGFQGLMNLPQPDAESRRWAKLPINARARRLFILARSARETAVNESCDRHQANVDAARLAESGD